MRISLSDGVCALYSSLVVTVLASYCRSIVDCLLAVVCKWWLTACVDSSAALRQSITISSTSIRSLRSPEKVCHHESGDSDCVLASLSNSRPCVIDLSADTHTHTHTHTHTRQNSAEYSTWWWRVMYHKRTHPHDWRSKCERPCAILPYHNVLIQATRLLKRKRKIQRHRDT